MMFRGLLSFNRCEVVVFICLVLEALIQGNCAQEKFTLLNSGNDNGGVREIRVERSSTPKSISTTKVPYKKIQCPPEPIQIPIFSLPCNHQKDCRVFGPNLACCKEHCIKGVLVPVDAHKAVTKAPPPKRTARVTNNVVPVVTNELNPISQVAPIKAANVTQKGELVCPKNGRVPFFSLPCQSKGDCRIFGRNLLCCRNVCIQGVFPPKAEVSHAPALFGLVDRNCPAQPLAELFDVKECESDADCLPRICCPEQNSANRKSYCRTPVHNIDRLPGAKRIQEPLRNFVSYMQCTPPPPRELFPKPCNNTLDCFPNLCCQENGKKFCRPPRRSLIALVADVTTRVGAVEATRKFIERITA